MALDDSTATTPAFASGPAPKARPPLTVKDPAAVTVARPPRAFVPAWFWIADKGPSRTIVAASVTTWAPVKRRMPARSYVPPVKVVPEKFANDAAFVIENSLPDRTRMMPAFVTTPLRMSAPLYSTSTTPDPALATSPLM